MWYDVLFSLLAHRYSPAVFIGFKIKHVDEISQPKKENNKCLLLNKQLTKIKYTGGGTHTLRAFEIAKVSRGKLFFFLSTCTTYYFRVFLKRAEVILKKCCF